MFFWSVCFSLLLTFIFKRTICSHDTVAVRRDANIHADAAAVRVPDARVCVCVLKQPLDTSQIAG